METNPHTLKDELEAEIKQTDSNRRNKFLAITFILLLLSACIVSLLLFSPRSASEEARESSSQTPGDTSNTPTAANEPEINPATSDVPPAREDAEHGVTSNPQPYTPPASSPIDKAAFIALGHQVGSRYADIVALVTFPVGMSSEEKATRTKQAYALDKEYFSEVTGLRGMVNAADSPPPEYMTAVQLAEAGAAAISAGMYGLNSWAERPSSASPPEGSLGLIEKGARDILQLSEKLNDL